MGSVIVKRGLSQRFLGLGCSKRMVNSSKRAEGKPREKKIVVLKYWNNYLIIKIGIMVE